MNDGQFPQMRAAVLSAVAAWADAEYQRRIWLEHRCPHANFYDDLDLGDRPDAVYPSDTRWGAVVRAARKASASRP
ncbi:hypothetical protein [Nocardia sp. NPDC058633]|uniref:hypothetical protein n=1 Tax=Nocardia sp. NPDC058633 TaxID=3346568 RepID=UPI00364CF57E